MSSARDRELCARAVCPAAARGVHVARELEAHSRLARYKSGRSSQIIEIVGLVLVQVSANPRL
jgi:hypothetical protein